MRRVMGYAGAGLVVLPCLAWILVIVKVIVLSAGGLAVLSVLSAAAMGAASAGRLKATACLRNRRRITDATIVSLSERYVNIPSGFTGWVTTVRVSFTDASGRLVSAEYADHARAGGKEEGQAMRIAYDPGRPVSIAPADTDPRVIDGFVLALGAAVSAGLAAYFALRAFG